MYKKLSLRRTALTYADVEQGDIFCCLVVSRCTLSQAPEVNLSTDVRTICTRRFSQFASDTCQRCRFWNNIYVYYSITVSTVVLGRAGPRWGRGGGGYRSCIGERLRDRLKFFPISAYQQCSNPPGAAAVPPWFRSERNKDRPRKRELELKVQTYGH